MRICWNCMTHNYRTQYWVKHERSRHNFKHQIYFEKWLKIFISKNHSLKSIIVNDGLP